MANIINYTNISNNIDNNNIDNIDVNFLNVNTHINNNDSVNTNFNVIDVDVNLINGNDMRYFTPPRIRPTPTSPPPLRRKQNIKMDR